MRPRKVILIGFDGALLSMVDLFIEDLPNFKRMMGEGSTTWANPSMPADTPTNWTTIATGAYPSTHGIFGFNKRIPEAPLRELIPTFNSGLCRAECLWQAAERFGKRCILINYPTAFPVRAKESLIVGGDGVSSKQWTIDGPVTFSTERGGFAEMVLREARGWKNSPPSRAKPLEAEIPALVGTVMEQSAFGAEVKRVLPGEDDFIMREAPLPPESRIDPAKRQALRYYLLVLDKSGGGYDTALLCKAKDAASSLAQLEPGKWAGPILDRFPTLAGDIEGAFWMKLSRLSADGSNLEVARTCVHRTRGWTHPEALAAEICANAGPYIEALEISNDRGDVDCYNELTSLQVEWLSRAANFLWKKYPSDLMLVQIHVPDGHGHRIGGYFSPRAKDLARPEEISRAKEQMRRCYIEMDRLLGAIWKNCKDEETVLGVVSDHGEVAAWRQVATMGLLVQAGFCAFSRRPSGRYAIDWSRTRVYRDYPGEHLYVNLKGREPEGVVEPSDYEKVRDEVIDFLKGVRDPETGDSVFEAVLRREEARHLGLWGDEVGDVLYYIKPYYYERVGQSNFFTESQWKDITQKPPFFTTLCCSHPYLPGGREGPTATSAMFLLAGPGIRKAYRRGKPIHLVDVAPTIAHLVGFDSPKDADGRIVQDFLAGK